MAGTLYCASMTHSGQIICDNRFVVMRFLKNRDYFEQRGWIWFPDLGPTPALFKQVQELKTNGMWNRDKFDTFYAPKYLVQIIRDDIQSRTRYNVLRNLLISGYDAGIVCTCPDHEMCHTSLLHAALKRDTSCEVVLYYR